MRPKPEIILFGEAFGVKEISQELGLRHIPDVKTNEFGTPLLSDLFKKAQSLATHDFICSINADIVVTDGLNEAAEIIRKRWQRFAIFCSRWEFLFVKEINFSSSDWKESFRRLVENNSYPPMSIGIDLFLFPRGFYQDIPDFAIGRLYWDNWLIFKALRQKCPVVDVSDFVFTVHPNHARPAFDKTPELIEEVGRNKRLCSWWQSSFIGKDATYQLKTSGQLRKKPFLELLEPRIKITLMYYLKPLPWQAAKLLKRAIYSAAKKIFSARPKQP